MFIVNFGKKAPLWYPADGVTPPADPPAGDPPADPPADPPTGETKLWWEGEGFAADKDWLTKKDFLTEDPNDALAKVIKSARNGEDHLGKSPDTIMDRPGKDQAMGEYMRANANVFGLPDSAEGYKLDELELPEGVEVDTELQASLREIAFDEGLTPAATNRLQAVYAERISGLIGDATEQLQTANAEMMTELESSWGDQTKAKMEGAQQAAQMLAEKAGIGSEGMLAMAQSMKDKVGDAGIIKMFSAVADLMGEDTLTGGGDGGNLSITPAEAKAEKEKIYAKGSEYDKAQRANDHEAVKKISARIDVLNKIIAK